MSDQFELSDTPLSWPIERWKWMFDGINKDCMEDSGGTGYIPYSDVGFYADQVSNIIDNCEQTISKEQALDIAKRLHTMDVIENIATIVVEYNKRCWEEHEDQTQVSLKDYGSDSETIAEIVDHMFLKDVVKLVIEKQSKL